MGLLGTSVWALPPGPLYTYTLAQDGTPAAYDEAMAVASLQGIINRASPDSSSPIRTGLLNDNPKPSGLLCV